MRYRSSVDVKLITRGRAYLIARTNQGRKERRNERVNAGSVCLSVASFVRLLPPPVFLRHRHPSYRDSVDFRNYFAPLFGAPGPAQCPPHPLSLPPSLLHSCPMYTVNSEYKATVVGGRKARPHVK